jgi:hypothetical protein
MILKERDGLVYAGFDELDLLVRFGTEEGKALIEKAKKCKCDRYGVSLYFETEQQAQRFMARDLFDAVDEAFTRHSNSIDAKLGEGE